MIQIVQTYADGIFGKNAVTVSFVIGVRDDHRYDFCTDECGQESRF